MARGLPLTGSSRIGFDWSPFGQWDPTRLQPANMLRVTPKRAKGQGVFLCIAFFNIPCWRAAWLAGWLAGWLVGWVNEHNGQAALHAPEPCPVMKRVGIDGAMNKGVIMIFGLLGLLHSTPCHSLLSQAKDLSSQANLHQPIPDLTACGLFIAGEIAGC